MKLPILTLTALLLTGAMAGLQAQDAFTEDDNGMRMPPQVDPNRQAPAYLEEGEFEGLPFADEDDDDQVPYRYPQAHEFQRPIRVGQDQLQVHTGYWQPGGYEPRSGSPFFHSVPGAPERGPLAGNTPAGFVAGDSAAAYYGGGNVNGYNGYNGNAGYYGNTQSGSVYGGFNPMTGYGYQGAADYGTQYAGGYGGNYSPGYSSQYGHNYYGNSGYNGGSANGAGGPGGDPYGYHFGPGYYRSGEYGHFRFPYYSYRRPWYHPGFAGYNRDTNIPW